MFEFLKKLFRSKPKFPLGAWKSPEDHRNIKLASFQKAVDLPTTFETNMPPIEDQKNDPKCVGEAIHKVGELYLEKHDIHVDLSPDDLYAQCKLLDGNPDAEGTYPSLGAKLACTSGMATVEAYESGDPEKIRESRAKYKLGGYAFVNDDFYSICQAIFQNGAICASFAVDNNWFRGIIKRVLTALGRHYAVLHGFDTNRETFIGQNSWGIMWIGYVGGIFDSRIAPGHFEVKWKDVKTSMIDMIVFADVPQKLIDEAKAKFYKFTRVLKSGSRGLDVTQLQKYLGMTDTDGVFGKDTKAAVVRWQDANGLEADGKFGPQSAAKMEQLWLKKN